MDFLDESFDSCGAGRTVGLTAHHVFGMWREMAAPDAPWCSMPADDRPGVIRLVTIALLDLSTGLYSSRRRQAIRHAAASHGVYRRDQGCTPETVVADFRLLRRSLKLAPLRLGATHTSTREFVRHVLPDWRLAQRVAAECYLKGPLRSGHRFDSSPD